VERRVQQPCGENHKSLLQEERFIVIQAVVNDVLEEALSFRVSSEHGDGYGTTTKEERRSPPRWHEGNKEHVHEVYRTSRAHGGAARFTTTIDPFDCATSIHSDIFLVWLHHFVGGGGEAALSS
jgi:hypothetical protein